jgi:uncharacterized membrane protein YphA (DoxX/SURF4 family)
MEKFKKASRIAYCIGLAGMVIPQFFYGTFGVNFFPPWPGLPWVAVWALLFTVLTLAACVAIVFEISARIVSLLLGGLLLAMYILGDIPYELFIDPYKNHLGSWTELLKESALAGGAFVVAGSFPAGTDSNRSVLIRVLEKLIPFGPALFCITMILYGYAHFLYTQFILTLVPHWIPGPTFWTLFAGVMLMASGIVVILNIKRKIVAILLGVMISIWLFIIHIPLAIADPLGKNGNEPISAFSAVAFIGIAFLIAANATTTKPKKILS